MSIEFDKESLVARPIARIKVIGIGGGGGNTVNSMIDAQFSDIEFITANTDAQALNLSKAQHRIQLGVKSTKGLGTGADPELGKRAAEEDLSKIMDYLEDADIVFLTGGMGGGTGSGGLPVVAKALKEKNILSIAVVTKPFSFEGKKRASVAQDAIDLLRAQVDTLVVIPNQKLLDTVDHTVSMVEAFSLINQILNQCVKGISDIIAKPGHINVDFADVKTIMKGMGLAVMGTGKASGKDRALQAAHQAISSDLLETMTIQGARSLLINISGGSCLSLSEIAQAAQVITQNADENANIIVGSVINDALADDVLITVIATGFALENCKEESVEQTLHTARAQQLSQLHKRATELSSIINNSLKPSNTQQEDLKNNVLSYEQATLSQENLDIPAFIRRSDRQKQYK